MIGQREWTYGSGQKRLRAAEMGNQATYLCEPGKAAGSCRARAASRGRTGFSFVTLLLLSSPLALLHAPCRSLIDLAAAPRDCSCLYVFTAPQHLHPHEMSVLLVVRVSFLL